MRKRRRKLYHFKDMVADGIEFFEFRSIKRQDGRRGTLYVLDKHLTSAQKEKISKYDNTEVCTVARSYAPEIKHSTLILYK